MEPSPRPLRADAARNRRRVIDAARRVFAERGLDAGVDTIACEAGVGVGTIYRRFPTKEHLLQAVVSDRLDAFCAELAGLPPCADPWDAFAAAAEALAGAVARDRGFFQLLREAHDLLPDPDEARVRSTAAIEPYLRRAQDAGAVRGDLVPADVLGLCAVAARLPEQRLERQPELWRRYLAIVLDGVRAEAAHPLPHPPPADPPPASAQRGLDGQRRAQ